MSMHTSSDKQPIFFLAGLMGCVVGGGTKSSVYVLPTETSNMVLSNVLKETVPLSEVHIAIQGTKRSKFTCSEQINKTVRGGWRG